MADPIDLITASPDSTDPANFATQADLAWAQIKTVIPQINTVATAFNLNSINDTSATTNTIGSGSKTFTVSAGKSFVKGMTLTLADSALPATNFLIGTVTAYSGTSLTVSVLQYNGTSGTSVSDWTISLSAPPAIPTVSSEIKLTGISGRGSTNTKVLRFTTVSTNTATADITYASSATLGDSWTVLAAGWYRIRGQVVTSSGAANGVTINCTQLSTGLENISNPDQVLSRYTVLTGATTSTVFYMDLAVYLSVNDVLRVQEGTTDQSYSSTNYLRIQKLALQGVSGGGGGGGSGAPEDAQYVVAAANGTLTNERVATSSTSILTDTGTAGQMKYKRAAISGDVTIAEDANSATIGNNVVTNAKMATMAAKTIKANSATSSGNAQDVTITGGLSLASSVLKSKGSFGFTFTYSTTTSGDPASGGIRMSSTTFASIATINLSITTLLSRNLSEYQDTWASGGQFCFISNNVSSTAYGIFDITANADNTTYRTLTVTPVAGVMPANGEELIIFYYPPGGAGLTTQQVLDMKVVRTDTNGQLIDNTGAVISGSPAVADYTALVALDEALYSNFVVIVESGLNRSGWISNGTTFTPFNGQYVQDRNNRSVVVYIAPESGITWTAANNGSNKVRLTSNAAHGLTTSPAVGASICVKTTQNGWTSGDFHEIATIVSTTQIDLTTTYSSHGVPVFYVKNEEVTVKTLALPVLRTNTAVILEMGLLYGLDAASAQKRVKVYLDSTQITINNNTASTSTAHVFLPFKSGFKNLNSTGSQRGLYGENSTGYVSNTLPPVTTAIDTSISKNLSVAFLPVSANATMELCDYTLLIRG